jgi:hypothetical protein
MEKLIRIAVYVRLRVVSAQKSRVSSRNAQRATRNAQTRDRDRRGAIA